MLAWPVVTPVLASRSVGISIRGAAKLIDELNRLGILVPATRRKSWRIYLTADLAGTASLSLAAAELPAPVKDETGVVPWDAEMVVRELAARSEPPHTAVYQERAPELQRPAKGTPVSGAPGDATDPPREPTREVDLSRVYRELDLITKRMRAAVQSAAQPKADSPSEPDPTDDPQQQLPLQSSQ
jgi:hypothetical protein